jgi:hypothetical protein
MATLITKAHKGMILRRRANEDLVEVVNVFRNPSTGDSFRAVDPFAVVIADERRTFVALTDLENDELYEVITDPTA